MGAEMIEGEVRPLPKRGISEATCQKFGYRIGSHKGRTVQIADYRDGDGLVVAQHIRTADKDFSWVGDASQAGLWGKHLWPGSGRRVVVCEGELDALSVAQAFGLSWAVVSIPNGAPAAKKAIMRDLEWLEGYDQVVFAFDMDTPGRAAAAECAALLSPGRAAIAEYPVKDANDLLLAQGVKAVCQSIYNARKWAPGGVINGSELWDRITETTKPGIPYPWAGLTEKTGGQKPGTLITWTSGTGQGKSSSVAQIAYELAFPKGDQEPHTVGYVALEEGVGMTAQRFLSYHLGKQVHHAGTTTKEEMRTAFDATLASGRIWVLDHFGSTDSDGLLSKLRYLAVGCGCRTLVLDHLSIVVSGLAEGLDERRIIDTTMTKLRTLVEETGVTLHLVSHLKRVEGTPAEEGGRVSLAHLRGSQAIAQLSDVVIGLERNGQAEGEEGRRTTVRVLKCRANGNTGEACKLDYDTTTGRLNEVPEVTMDGRDDSGF